MVELLYFAWVRERIGLPGERVEPPVEVTDVRGLIAWLAGRSAGHQAALGDAHGVRVAVDQRFASLDAPLDGVREVALFPPVTGG